jgi:hypothetical protein
MLYAYCNKVLREQDLNMLYAYCNKVLREQDCFYKELTQQGTQKFWGISF